MKKLLILGTLSVFLMNCNKKAEPIPQKADTDTVAIEKPAIVDTLGAKSFCYLGVMGKDSVFASIDDNLGTISGKLAYKNNEKDSSKGDIYGFKSGDTLKLTYEFEAEGSKSKRDIFFIQKDNTLMEGIGKYKEENGVSKYSNEKKITYTDGVRMETTDCIIVTKGLQ